MKPINPQFTAEEAEAVLKFVDAALKAHGILVLKAANAVTDKIQAAAIEAQKPEQP